MLFKPFLSEKGLLPSPRNQHTMVEHSVLDCPLLNHPITIEVFFLVTNERLFAFFEP